MPASLTRDDPRIAEIRSAQQQWLDYADSVGEGSPEYAKACAEFDKLQAQKEALRGESSSSAPSRPAPVEDDDDGYYRGPTAGTSQREITAALDEWEHRRGAPQVPAGWRAGPATTLIAYHESAHAIAAAKLGWPPIWASVVACDRYDGAVMFQTDMHPLDKAVALYAGQECERVVTERFPDLSRSEKDEAMLRHLLGDSSEMHVNAKRAARELVGNSMGPIRALAAALLDRGTLLDGEIRAVLHSYA